MKMNKKILSAAVLAVLGTGSAQAVNLSENGTGQVLLFPYYTAQGNEETLLTVVNTTDKGKIVKIRFREAYNSREVLDFNIYMSKYDVWTGKVLNNNGTAALVTYDNTCTVPKLSVGSPISFRTYNYDGSKSAGYPADGAPTGVERTLEGYVEIIEMGVPDDNNPTWDADNAGAGDGIPDYQHVDGTPQNCDTMVNNWKTGGVWAGGANTNVNAPSGGIFGSLAIINVQAGTEVAVAATALNNVYNAPKHSDPGDENPTLGAASPPVSDVVVDTGGAGAVTVISDTWTKAIDAVSAVLMAQHVYNEYTVNPAVEAESAWIVTFPTKGAYVDQTNDRVDSPFTQSFFEADNASGHVGRGKACEPVDVVAYDREEHFKTAELDFSPRPPGGGFELCYEANVIQFGQSNVFSASNTVSTLSNLPGNAGWVDMSFTAAGHKLEDTVTGTHEYLGLPVIGFKATVLGNSNVGVGASYATGVEHAYKRVVN